MITSGRLDALPGREAGVLTREGLEARAHGVLVPSNDPALRELWLLSHTADLRVRGHERGWVDKPMATLVESPSGASRGGMRIIQQLESAFLYSGRGYTVPQLMIEEVGGRSFEAYTQNEILHPLGMTESNYQAWPQILTRKSAAYTLASWIPRLSRRPDGVKTQWF